MLKLILKSYNHNTKFELRIYNTKFELYDYYVNMVL